MTFVTRTRLVASVAALSLVLAACSGGGSSATDDTAGPDDTIGVEQAELSFVPITAGKLTVCSDAPYEPFEFQDESGKWTGFDMDLMTAIAQRYGLTLEVTVQPFDGIWLAPQAKTCDVVASSVTITEERAQNAAFSDPYFDSFQSLLVRSADAETLVDVTTLDGKTLAVQTGTTGEAYAKENIPSANIQSFDDAAAMFLALESNQVDGVLQDYPINAWRATKQGTSAVSIKFDEQTEQYGFVVAQDNTDLLGAINESLGEFKATGLYDQIYAKYFGSYEG